MIELPSVEIETLTADEKIGQVFFIGIPGDTVDQGTKSLLYDVKPGGICLFARNIREAEQTRTLLDSVTEHCRIKPFLSIDQEGGLVDRLRRILSPMPAASRIPDPATAAEQAKLIAEALSQLGLNMDFAPVVDVIDAERERSNNGLHSRAYGRAAPEVVDIAGPFLAALQSNGIIGCLKHFPGLGASQVDSHEELPNVNIAPEAFEEMDLYPYRQLIGRGGVKCVMVAHAVYPNLGLQETGQDGKLLPSSLSFNIVTQLLRKELGFDGLVLTDDLEMGAIVNNYGIGEAAVMALTAGHDMVAICAGVDAIRKAHAAVSSAVESGRLSEARLSKSVSRILRLKAELASPVEFDTGRIASIAEEIAQLDQRLA